MTRQRIATQLGVPDATLRLWESDELLPRFSAATLGDYMIRVRLVRAARAAGLSGQEVRQALRIEKEVVA